MSDFAHGRMSGEQRRETALPGGGLLERDYKFPPLPRTVAEVSALLAVLNASHRERAVGYIASKCG